MKERMNSLLFYWLIMYFLIILFNLNGSADNFPDCLLQKYDIYIYIYIYIYKLTGHFIWYT